MSRMILIQAIKLDYDSKQKTNILISFRSLRCCIVFYFYLFGIFECEVILNLIIHAYSS